MATYPYATSKRDYGPRKGTVGLDFHMTEGNGGDGDLRYLRLDPSGRGVSANFFSHRDGTIWRLLPWDHTAGTLNPADRSSDKGYYSDEILRSVLSGGRWMNPNVWVLSIEVGGKRADGPNDLQVAACIAWGLDMRERYGAELVGSFGHADQTDTKGCPGTTAAMKAIFTGIGGHGLFTEDDVRNFTMVVDGSGRLITGTATYKPSATPADDRYLRLKDGTLQPYPAGLVRPVVKARLTEPIVAGKPKTDDWTLGWVGGKEDAFFLLERSVTTVLDPEPIANCDKAVADAIAATKASAHIADPTITFA